MRNLLPISLLSLISLYSCTSGNKPEKQGADSVSSAQKKPEQIQQQQPNVVHADEKTLWQDYEQAGTILIGSRYETPYESIPDKLKEIIPPLMQSAAMAKAVITGSFMVVMDDLPILGKKVSYFIGIPVKRKVQATGLNYLQLEPGRYLKVQLTAEPGKGMNEHMKLLQQMNAKNITVQGPVIETYSESKNGNMTTVLNKATFYYRRK